MGIPTLCPAPQPKQVPEVGEPRPPQRCPAPTCSQTDTLVWEALDGWQEEVRAQYSQELQVTLQRQCQAYPGPGGGSGDGPGSDGATGWAGAGGARGGSARGSDGHSPEPCGGKEAGQGACTKEEEALWPPCLGAGCRWSGQPQQREGLRGSQGKSVTQEMERHSEDEKQKEN